MELSNGSEWYKSENEIFTVHKKDGRYKVYCQFDLDGMSRDDLAELQDFLWRVLMNNKVLLSPKSKSEDEDDIPF